MTGLDQLAVLGAGLFAGTINTIVGSGSLLTFPTLLAFGFSPVVANVSNTVGLVPGSVSGAWGYRRELSGQRRRLVRFTVVAGLGGLAGAVLLLVLPAAAFKDIVPALIILACVLVVAQPAITRRLEQGRRRPARDDGGPLLLSALFGTGVYGGYFGAAQGVMFLAILGISLRDDLQRLNAAKNLIAAVVNGLAGILFIAVAHVAWRPAILLAVGSIAGGQVGAKVGRRLPATWLRAIIVVVGIIAVVKLL